jgi:hypothetical protein
MVYLTSPSVKHAYFGLAPRIRPRPLPYLLFPIQYSLNMLAFGAIYSMAQQPLVSQGLLIIETSRSHSDTPRSVGLLWTTDQADAETST